ncbi:MAG: GtrA family protein, partial [Dysosmobacter sp.]|nr:GtrA family protein [Dysosmobacter sp.]
RGIRDRGWREAGEFALSRLFSLGLETVLLVLMVNLLSMNALAAKLLVAVVVVVVNYLTGLLVFNRKRGA